jgi:hypothetical protein
MRQNLTNIEKGKSLPLRIRWPLARLRFALHLVGSAGSVGDGNWKGSSSMFRLPGRLA